MSDNPFSGKVINEETVIIETGKQLDNNNAHEMVEMIVSIQL